MIVVCDFCFLWTKLANSATPMTLARTPHTEATTAMTVAVAEPCWLDED